MAFEFVHSDAVGNSGGILCAWDPNCSCRDNITKFDSFVMVRGVWRLTGQKYMLIAIYAPHELNDKHRLWEYLQREIKIWRGEVVVMGDFNEGMVEDAWKVYPCKDTNDIRYLVGKLKYLKGRLRLSKVKWAVEGDENLGFFHGILNKKRSILNVRGVMVDGIWVDNPHAVKKEFYDHFKQRFCQPGPKGASIQIEFPNRILEEELEEIECDVTNEEIKRANAKLAKDFRPISLIGSFYKIIAKILDNWLVNVLDEIVNEVQSAFIKDKQILDGPFILNEIIQWCKQKHKKALIFKVDFEKAYDSVRWDFLDEVLRKFGFSDKWCKWIQCCLISSRGSILVNGSPTEVFQFGKRLKQGDPLSPFLFILIMENGIWVDNPHAVKKEFYDHFKQRFCQPGPKGASIQIEFPNRISEEELEEIECDVTNEEIKRAVWECGTDKAPGHGGFTFGFFRRFWELLECDVTKAVSYFFVNCDIPKGCNSSFITLILKHQNAKLAKDFRPISLIGSFYKIIAKILDNRLVNVLDEIVNEVQSAFIKDKQILDGPFILNEIIQWCKQKHKKALIFKVDFEKAYDSVVDARMFHGINIGDGLVKISHMFYADDVMFVGQWCDSNINTLVYVLDCFHKASGLRINMCKCKIMGVHVDEEMIRYAATLE
nr:RNA-directed DNA polymerase, eukaryota [Tanacetum cinerariifolium]